MLAISDSRQWEGSLWAVGRSLHDRPINCTPRLASWNSMNDRAQSALHTYLRKVESDVKALAIPAAIPLAIRLDVFLRYGDNLTTGRDLENYLTPLCKQLFQILPGRFVHASAIKNNGEPGQDHVLGQIVISAAEPLDIRSLVEWEAAFVPSAGSAPKQKRTIENRIRNEVVLGSCRPLNGEGPVAVHLAWRYATEYRFGIYTRNWINMWKRTGDSMGPILGHSERARGPRDDRVTHLHLHLVNDGNYGNDAAVGLWWKPSC